MSIELSSRILEPSCNPNKSCCTAAIDIDIRRWLAAPYDAICKDCLATFQCPEIFWSSHCIVRFRSAWFREEVPRWCQARNWAHVLKEDVCQEPWMEKLAGRDHWCYPQAPGGETKRCFVAASQVDKITIVRRFWRMSKKGTVVPVSMPGIL